MPKIVIECQGCTDSLTIIYNFDQTTSTNQVPLEYLNHMAYLMFHHLKYHPVGDPQNSAGIDTTKIVVDTSNIDPLDLTKVKYWVKVVKPP